MKAIKEQQEADGRNFTVQHDDKTAFGKALDEDAVLHKYLVGEETSFEKT